LLIQTTTSTPRGCNGSAPFDPTNTNVELLAQAVHSLAKKGAQTISPQA
jgi:hypothetical protein